ncbi:MAG TPA: GNAT family N-acetyltransferase, partial [Longimicrobium sp.]|nr:GNAT family N-acetyltransferase [Longimicrobium sp.]
MMDDLELMRLHVQALFTHDARGRMVRVNEAGGGPAPRFFLGRTRHGRVWRFRADVDDALALQLEALCRAEPAADERLAPPYGTEAYQALLARAAPVARTWTGPAYRVPPGVAAAPDAVLVTEENRDLLRPHMQAWLGDVASCHPMLAVLDGARAVCLCASVRRTPHAHEAGVETAPEFRGRGCAARAVAAWAAAVQASGALPLYSTSWENTASQALARR